MTEKYRISVIIPVFNGEKYLKEAIDSVLNQSHKPYEVIVIDDGSTDGTSELLNEYKDFLRYTYQENLGDAAARNLGVAQALGSWIAFLDADDYWVMDKLFLQTARLSANNETEAVFGLVKQFFSPETSDSFRKKITCPSKPSAGYCPGTMLIRKDSFMKMGYFTTRYKRGAFIDWFAKAQEKDLKIDFVPEVLLYRRIHYNNHGLTHKTQTEDYMNIVKTMLYRQKNKGVSL